MSDIQIQQKAILIDNKPQLIISGEVHYYRLNREDWRDRLEKLRDAGCNTVASYIPWLCHEPVRGEFDLDGHTRDNLDLGAFIDLAHELGLWFIARPGPFIMAEMKNEGVPFYLYDDYPEIVPVTWDGKPAPTRTLDYLAPNFLAATGVWYDHVMPVLAERLLQHGRNIISVQLDNEVGMLSWVSNAPDLTDNVTDDFWNWQESRYGKDVRYPFSKDKAKDSIRSPQGSYVGKLMNDLAHYMRNRFARYFDALRSMAEERGVRDVPFIVNIHGTEAGGGASYPIGISQLYESYAKPGYISGSDHYLGNLTLANAPDWYLMNAYQDSVNSSDQPLTSVEFEAGEGDYGSSMGARLDPSALAFKLRMAVAQGNRLVNYYLFTGGINYRMDADLGDGNDRISFTGERHGTGAPVNPEGVLSYTYPALTRGNTTMSALAEKVSVATEQVDNLTMAFVPDYYATESVYPQSDLMTDIATHLKRNRFGGPGGWLARALFQATVRYRSLNVQNDAIDPATTPILAIGSARYMSADLQQKLIDYTRSGGKLLLMGELPLFDMEGEEGRLLIDALGLEHVGERYSTHRYFLSVTGDLWARDIPEWRAGWAQTFTPVPGKTLLHVYGEDEALGFDLPLGEGRAIVITGEIPLQIGFLNTLLEQLGVERGLRHTNDANNIFLSSVSTPEGDTFIHALNFDGFDKSTQLHLNGESLFDGREISLRRRDGVMLPVNVQLGDVTVVWSTAEIAERLDDGLVLRLTGENDAICLHTGKAVVESPDYAVETAGENVIVTAKTVGHGDGFLTVRWQ